MPDPAPSGASEIGELRRIAEMAIQALAAATANQQPPRPRKPELPEFDKKNVEIWIGRVNAAYERAGVTTAKERFAHLESKFDVSFNPKINSFLYGPTTEDAWKDFLQYLREEYGETRRQEANRVLQPLQRNGLRPTQLLAQLVEKTSKVTLDDIRKEKIIAALPADVQRSIIDKVETLSAEETAALADRFFNKDGQPLQPPASAAVNNVDETAPGVIDTDNEEEVSAIPNRQRRRYPQRPERPATLQPKVKSNAPAKGTQSKVSAQPLCWRHIKFGKDAKFCEPGCSMYTPDQSKAKAGQRA